MSTPNFINSDIRLHKEEHIYSLKSDPSIEFTSCTSFIKEFFRKFDAPTVAQKLVSSVPKYRDYTVEELIAEWNAAADHGTAVHEELENFILDKTAVTHEKSQRGVQWILDNLDPEKFELFPEVIIFCKELKLAGTIDLIGIHKKSGALLLFDWKTNKRIDKRAYGNKKGIHHTTSDLDDCNYIHYTAQLSLYRYLLEKNYGAKVHRQIIIHLSESDAKVIDCDYLAEHITNMLQSLN